MPKVILTDQNFAQEVLQESSKPVLVDFWAEWCGPCRIQGPIVEQLAQEFEGKAKIGSLDVDANPRTSQQYNVLSIPTLAIFKNGKIQWQVAGVQQKQKLVEQLTEYL